MEEKNGNATGSLVNGAGAVPLFQSSRSEVIHCSRHLLLHALERHKAARSSAGRLTVKGGKHRVRGVSPSIGAAAVTRETASVGGLVLGTHHFLKCPCQRFRKYLHFCKKTF